MDKIKKGRFGEEIAKRFLASLGYQLLASNFRTRLGEIDIIAKDKEDIVFVEVKTRNADKWGMGAEAVTEEKKERMQDVALLYLQSQGLGDVPIRFEVVEVLLKKGKARLIRDAF